MEIQFVVIWIRMDACDVLNDIDGIIIQINVILQILIWPGLYRTNELTMPVV